MKTALTILSIVLFVISISFGFKILKIQEEHKNAIRDNISHLKKNNELLQELKQCKANYESIAQDYFDLPIDYEIE